MKRWEWALLAGVAVLLRGAHVWLAAQSGDYEITSLDGAFYRDAALALADGTGRADAPYLLSPLYPLLLVPFVHGGVLAEHAVWVAQALLGVGTVLCTAALAQRSSGRAAAWLAGGLAATFGPLVHFESHVALAGPQTFFLMAALLAWCWPPAPRRPWLAPLLAGIAFGLSAGIRPTGLAVGATAVLLEPLFARYQRAPLAPAFRRAAFLALGLSLTIVPFTLRNVVASGEPVLLSAAGGMNLWIGNHRGASGLYDPPPGYDFAHEPMARDIAERDAGRPLTDSEASRWWRAKAIADIAEAPLDWLRLMATKALLLLHPMEIPNLGVGYEDFRGRDVTLFSPIDARVVLVLGLLAPFWLPAGARRQAVARLWWATLAYLAAVGLFFVTGRYRLPILPAAMVLAATTVVGAVRQWRAGVPGAKWAVALPALLLLATVPVYQGAHALLRFDPSGSAERHEAERLASRGRYAEAAAAYRRSIATEDSAIARVNLAAVEVALGHPASAMTHLERARRLAPDDPVVHHRIGLLLWREFHRPAAAEAALLRAVELRPDDAGANLHAGQLLFEREKPQAALPLLERAVDESSASTPLGREARLWRDRVRRRVGGR